MIDYLLGESKCLEFEIEAEGEFTIQSTEYRIYYNDDCIIKGTPQIQDKFLTVWFEPTEKGGYMLELEVVIGQTKDISRVYIAVH